MPNQSVKIKQTILEILQGDILSLSVDALVNPVPKDLWMGRGTSKVIRDAAGSQIEEEAMSKAPVKLGEIVVTSGGNLPQPHIFHAAVIPPEVTPDREAVRVAMRNILEMADTLQVKSIGIPMLSGIKTTVPYDLFSRVMLQEAFVYLNEKESQLERVIFCLYNTEAYSAFKNQLSMLRQEYLI